MKKKKRIVLDIVAFDREDIERFEFKRKFLVEPCAFVVETQAVSESGKAKTLLKHTFTTN